MAYKLNLCHDISAEGMLKTLRQELAKHQGETYSVMTENPYVISYEQISRFGYAICIREWGKKIGLLIRDAGLGYFLAAGIPCKMEDIALETVAQCIQRNPVAFSNIFNAAFQYWDTVNAACRVDGLSAEPKDFPFVVYSDLEQRTSPCGQRMGWLVG